MYFWILAENIASKRIIPDEILNYFTSKITVSHPTVVTSSLISTLLFAMAISMLLGAFGILKMAANTLEDSGITM